MNERIKDKIGEIEQYLQELAEIAPENFEEYESDFKIKAACERYFEKIVEAVVDLAFIFVKEKKFKLPEHDIGALGILRDKGIISDLLKEKIEDAKSMRNFIAHKYGEINDELVFNAISEQLEKDIREFLNSIKHILK